MRVPAFAEENQEPAQPVGAGSVVAAGTVEIDPTTTDEDIVRRLTGVLEATGWYSGLTVRVDQGVVFLEGTSESDEHIDFASELTRKTEDVAVVVNQMEVLQPPAWDLEPAWLELEALLRSTIRTLPMLILGLAMMLLATVLATLAARLTRHLLRARVSNALLRSVVARAVAVPVFVLGAFVVLHVSGMTALAVSIIGGTGLVGLVLGFAFRDIVENFLASVLLSVQQPFASGDLVRVADQLGYVQHMNMRSTLLMTLEGNHVQIPNATVYKGVIMNYTANRLARVDFAVGIGFSDEIGEAQRVIMAVLEEHPAVVDDPEPLVLVEELGAATVQIRAYFWADLARHDKLKIRSAVIRMSKNALENAEISMPDEAREVVFPEGVPLLQEGVPQSKSVGGRIPREEAVVEVSEGDLISQAPDLARQARSARNPGAGPEPAGRLIRRHRQCVCGSSLVAVIRRFRRQVHISLAERLETPDEARLDDNANHQFIRAEVVEPCLASRYRIFPDWLPTGFDQPRCAVALTQQLGPAAHIRSRGNDCHDQHADRQSNYRSRKRATHEPLVHATLSFLISFRQRAERRHQPRVSRFYAPLPSRPTPDG